MPDGSNWYLNEVEKLRWLGLPQLRKRLAAHPLGKERGGCRRESASGAGEAYIVDFIPFDPQFENDTVTTQRILR